jgi:hydroxyacylglutathione hydrolase
MRKLRESGEFSTPSTLRSERETNPFMRCSSPEIRETVKRQDPHNDLTEVSVLRVLRQLKDEF